MEVLRYDPSACVKRQLLWPVGQDNCRSISMSYNSNLGDEGVLVLVKNLPATVTEIGLVNSNIGDTGGEALISWARKAKKLLWLCIEENTFSNEMINRLRRFSKERNNRTTVPLTFKRKRSD